MPTCAEKVADRLYLIIGAISDVSWANIDLVSEWLISCDPNSQRKLSADRFLFHGVCLLVYSSPQL